MSEQINDELFWAAAQYAAGDLPDEAALEFEQRLESDQTAREALAQAVALSEAVAQAEVMPVVPAGGERRRWTAAIAWIAVATAACLALTFVYRFGRDGGNVVEAPAGDAQLAAAWVEGQTAMVVAPADEVLLSAETRFFAETGDDEFELPPMNVEPTAPDWLIAAVVDAAGPATRGEN